MTVSFRCPSCGKGHKAPERAVGRQVNCLNCSKPMTVPAAEEKESDVIPFQTDSEALPEKFDTSPVAESPKSEPVSSPVNRAKNAARVDPTLLPPLTTNDPPFWRRHLHWLLVLALLPLVVSLLTKVDETSFGQHFGETLEQLSPNEREKILGRFEQAESLDDILKALPRQRLRAHFWAGPRWVTGSWPFWQQRFSWPFSCF